MLGFSTAATVAAPAGTYAITPWGNLASNYAISYVDGTLTVSAAVASTPIGAGAEIAAHRFDGRAVVDMGDFMTFNILTRPDNLWRSPLRYNDRPPVPGEERGDEPIDRGELFGLLSEGATHASLVGW